LEPLPKTIVVVLLGVQKNIIDIGGVGNFVGESINGCKFELQEIVKERGGGEREDIVENKFWKKKKKNQNCETFFPLCHNN